jgi:dTDP-glucose 4,6-dehydratase/UDP-glucose 4-epimerase
MKVVVTGASGFLGSRLTERLAAAGHRVVAVSRSSNPEPPPADTSIRWMVRDILRDGLDFEEIESADAVFHLAAAKEIAPGQDERMLIEANEMLTSRLIHGLGGVTRKLIFASSQMVYGDPGHTAVTEEFPLLGMTSSPYACSKLNAENWLRCLQKKQGGSCVSLRFCGFVEGGGNIDYIIDKALSNQPIVLLSRGQTRRDYLPVEDGIDAFMLTLGYRANPGFEAFNIGSGQMVGAAELARSICAELGSQSEVILSDQPAPRSDFVFNIDKAKRSLGFNPGSLPEAVLRYARRKQAAFNTLATNG